MPKIIFTTLFAFILVLPLAAQAGLPEAVTYLKTQSLDDWTAQALVAAGETIDATPLQSFSGSSVTDYAKRIMALVAVGKNPATYTGTDLISGLKSFEQSGQLGDASLINDDAWGIMALSSVGTPAGDTLIKNSAQFLVDNQNADGGWSWGVGFDSDTNDTAAVLMALASAGYTITNQAVQDGVAYLASQQNDDAGFPYQLPCFWPGCEASDSASTSWVISALTKLILDPASWQKSGVSPQEFLLTLQTGDGSFKWQAADPAGSAGMTAYAAVALAGKSYPVKIGNYLGGNGSGPTPLADLAIKFTNESIIINEGEQAGLTVKLINNGPTMAQNVVAELTLPEGLELVQATPTDGVFDQNKNSWTFIRLNNFAAAELNLVLSSVKAISGEISAVVSARELDFNQTNNEAKASFTAVAIAKSAEVLPEAGEVLGETAYSCEPAPTIVLTNWLGHIISISGSLTPWYIDPVSRQPYCLADSQTAYGALEKYGLGITNADLSRIPVGPGEINTVEPAEADVNLVNRLKGRILLQVESYGEAWYVNPADGRRYYLADGQAALTHLSSWRVVVEQ